MPDQRPKRPAPYCIRFTADERASLERDAGDMPLATFIKLRLFAGEQDVDRKLAARVLALLGSSGVFDFFDAFDRAHQSGEAIIPRHVGSQQFGASMGLRAAQAPSSRPRDALAVILKANTRSGGRALARHLLNERDNDQVEVHSVTGFSSKDPTEAMREHDAIAKSCRSKQTLFSVSLNPPKDKTVEIAVFEDAIARIEERNGLAGQPRIVIFHEKDGRRHCHAAWSRIDPEKLTVKPLSFYKMKCKDLSRELFLENGWTLPRGFQGEYERPFNLDEWQRSKRIGHDLRELRLLAKESWQLSQDQASFAGELEKRGLYLCKGDSRSHLALTVEGEPFAIAKLLSLRAKEVRARLGQGDDLRGVDAARTYIADAVMPNLRGLMEWADAERDARLAPFDARREAMKAQHHTERKLTDAGLAARARVEAVERESRLRSGLAGLWDRLRGERQRIQAQIERLIVPIES